MSLSIIIPALNEAANLPELLAELEAGDGLERRSCWRVFLSGKLVCNMVSEPITKTEAMKAVSRWPNAEVRP